MTDIVLASLTKRRAEMVAEAKTVDASLRRILNDIDHLDGAIRTYDAAYKAPKTNLSRAKRVEVSRIALNILRQAGAPMTLRDVTMAVMAQQGHDTSDAKKVQQRQDKVRAVLLRQRKNGALRPMPGVGQLVLWEVAI